MATMRGGGMNLQAERGGRGQGKGTDLPKRKVSIKKLWPTIWTLVKPRRWLLVLGLVLVAIKTVAGLTLPFLSKPLMDNAFNLAHPRPRLLPPE